METTIYFRETQEFDRAWLWGLVGLGALADLANFARGKWSTRETATRLATLGAPALLLRIATLQTEVRDDGLYLRFAPFHRSPKRIPFSDLTDLQETGYSPLRYGGWGIRLSPRGIAYTVSGKSGVRVERADGKSVFVGSDHPDELVGAVQEATERTV